MMKHKSEGQSLVECALLLPFMMVLMLGVLEIGRAIYITIRITNGATAGVNYGAQNPAKALDVTGIQNAALCDADGSVFPPSGQLSSPTCNTTGILTQGNITPTTGCTCDAGGGNSCNPMPPESCSGFSCEPGSIVVECVKVTTTATFNSLFPYPGLPNQFVANGNAIMRVRK